MTFPHPVWMSWWLIPSNAASPHDIEPAIPPPHLCPQTPQSRAELSPARLPWWWEGEPGLKITNRSDADRGQRAGLQNISQREAYGVLNTSGIALVPWVLTDKTDGWIFHEDRSHNNIIQRREMSRGNSKYIKEMCVLIILKMLWWIKWLSVDCKDKPIENYHSTTAPLSSTLLSF